MPIALAYLAFVALGLPDGMPGAGWPLLAPDYRLAPSALGAWLAAAFAGYVASGLAAGAIMARVGVGRLLTISVALTAAAALGQAARPPWPGLLALALLSGLGAGAVDTAMNLVVARRFGPRQVNWLHACWGIGATAGPLALGLLLAWGAAWPAGFAAIGVALALLALAFAATWRRWAAKAEPAEPPSSWRQAMRLPTTRAGIPAFFLYTGVEAAAGQWAASVLVARGWGAAEASTAAAAFWGALTIGRIAAGTIATRVAAPLLPRAGAVTAALAIGAFASGPGPFDAAALALAGFALAPIYPTLMALTPARTGAAAPHAIGVQVAAAMAGGLLLPALAGALADRFGIPAVPVLVAAAAAMLILLIRRLTPRS